jgi:hypothetical protein
MGQVLLRGLSLTLLHSDIFLTSNQLQHKWTHRTVNPVLTRTIATVYSPSASSTSNLRVLIRTLKLALACPMPIGLELSSCLCDTLSLALCPEILRNAQTRMCTMKR